MSEKNEQGSFEVAARVDRLFTPTGDRPNQTLAFCSAVIGGQFVCHGIRLIDGKNGIFMSMPGREYKNRESGKRQFADVFHAVTREGREVLFEAIKAAYDQALEEAKAKEE